MGQHYSQLTEGERNQIYALRKAGHDPAAIADQLGRSRSTVCREIQRNTGQRGYRPQQAQRLAMERREAKAHPRKMTRPVVEHIKCELPPKPCQFLKEFLPLPARLPKVLTVGQGGRRHGAQCARQ